MPTRESTPAPTPTPPPPLALPPQDDVAAELRRREEVRRRQLDDLVVATSDPVGLAYRDSVVRALEEVRAAISRLADGTYGQCGGCGEAIAPARLEAAPSAVLCVPCAVRTRYG